MPSRENCRFAAALNDISVTRKRAKCTETSGAPASMALQIGSRAVFEDGVSIPRRRAPIVMRCGLRDIVAMDKL